MIPANPLNLRGSRKNAGNKKMEYTGFEPVASTMRMLRAPNCANTPYRKYNTPGGKIKTLADKNAGRSQRLL